MEWNQAILRSIMECIPDLHHDILDLVTEGDKVAVRYNIIGTYKGEFQGIPPTGQEVSFSALDFITLIDGKVAEEWEIADNMGLMQQIGAIPTPPSATRGSSNGSSSTARP